MRLSDWLEERVGWRGLASHVLDEPIRGGASWAFVFGSVLLFALILQMVTGVLLAFTYSPSTSSAWASVAYLQDQVALGWLVRGLHHHGASAIVIVAGLHLFQVALWGGYRRPREANWATGVLLLGLLLAFALTGYLLPWDQTGYWATKVATGIAGSTPMVGDAVQAVAQGGNEYGNLTLTRFYALHVLVLPALTITLAVIHVALFRRHGVTPHWWLGEERLGKTQPFWPNQLSRDIFAMALAFAALVTWTVAEGGARLDGPADPSSNFDARPEWYFRPLFQLLKYFGGAAETVAALGTPVVVLAVLLGLPWIDRAPTRHPRRRIVPLAILLAGVVAAGVLTALSLAADAADPELAKRRAVATRRAEQARRLARANGVPAAGGVAVFQTAPHWRARRLFAEHCAHCHLEGDERKGPLLGPGYGSRAWIRGFLLAPSSDPYFGRTKLAKTDKAMEAVEARGDDLDALVELVYAQSGATDVDAQKSERGRLLFEDTCTDCHERDPGVASDPGPNLSGRGSAEQLMSLIANPKAPIHYGDRGEMPRFDDELDERDRRAIALWLVWLRTASDADVAALGPL